MAGISISFPTFIGNIQIYASPLKTEKARRLLGKTPTLLNKAYELTSNAYAKRIREIAMRCLRRGMPPQGSNESWPPHTKSTIDRIGEHTLLYWSSQYYHHIRIIKRGKTISVGVPPGLIKTRPDLYKPKHRMTLSQVAKILENGSDDGRIPPRPLWKHLWNAVGGKEAYKKAYAKNLRKLLKTV